MVHSSSRRTEESSWEKIQKSSSSALRIPVEAKTWPASRPGAQLTNATASEHSRCQLTMRCRNMTVPHNSFQTPQLLNIPGVKWHRLPAQRVALISLNITLLQLQFSVLNIFSALHSTVAGILTMHAAQAQLLVDVFCSLNCFVWWCEIDAE
jgi:hypothetical protein